MTEFLQIAIGGTLVGAAYACIALGLYLVYRVTGVINLAQGAFCVLAALIAWSLQTDAGLGPLAAGSLAVVLTTLVGAVVGGAVFVPGLSRLSNGNMLMLSAGVLTTVQGALQAGWGTQPFALPPMIPAGLLRLGTVSVPAQGMLVLAVSGAAAVLLWLALTRTGPGRALRACAENPVAARLVGISVPRMTLVSYALSTALGAIAGVVIAPTTSLQFDSGRLFTTQAFMAVIIGGLGSFSGAVIGGLLLGIVGQLATAYVSSLFSSSITLILLLVVLVLQPSGLVGGRTGRRQDVREEARVHTHLTRLRPSTAVMGGLLLLALLLALPLVSSGPVLSALVIAAILFVALIGLDVVMGYAGQVNLGQAGFMAVGGYTSGAIAANFDVEPLLGVAAGIGLAVVCALVLSLVTVRLRGLYLALATLAFGLLVDSFAVGLLDLTGGPSGLVGIPGLSLGPIDFDTPERMFYLVVGLDAVLVVLLRGALGAGFGRALQAIRTDPLAAAALGIPVVRLKVVALAISAALGALSGALYAHFFHFLSPEMVGTVRSLELVAMLVVGGEGTLVGPAVGSLLLTLLPTVSQPLALYKTFGTGVLLVGFFLFLPQGLFGWLVPKLQRERA